MKDVLEGFEVGKKVKICGYQGFELGITGTIDYPPQVSIFLEDFGDNYFRKVSTLKGKKNYVWIVFDDPHYDADGDGPYSMAEIMTDNLEIIKN